MQTISSNDVHHVAASPKKPKNRRLRVSDLPNHLQPLDLHDHSFSLTEEEMSLTEIEGGSSSAALTEEVYQQILETRSPQPHDDDDDDDDDDESLLLPLPDLIDRLSQVALASADNAGMSSSGGERRMLEHHHNMSSSTTTLSMEDMTNILRHINLCEGTGTEPRWDLIRELTHHHDTNKAAADTNACLNHAAGEHDMAAAMAAFHESGSIPVEALYHEVNDADSGFTLDAVTHSCASSVTWFEGSQIEEVEITDDELDESIMRHQSDAMIEADTWYS